jgi:hypothetical protein
MRPSPNFTGPRSAKERKPRLISSSPVTATVSIRTRMMRMLCATELSMRCESARLGVRPCSLAPSNFLIKQGDH